MKRRLKKDEEAKIQCIKDNPLNYPPPPIPSLPLVMNPTMSIQRRVRAVQRYISAFEYNYTGQSFVSLRRDKGIKHLIFAAKTIIRESLPIQCVEALFLAVYFTNNMELLRVPISFTSCTDGKEYHHIVLGIKNKRHWGAMGISRLPNIMDKPINHSNLRDLIINFVSSYESYFHKVVRIDLGLPFSHDSMSETPLQWRVIKLTLGEDRKTWDDHQDAFLQYSRDCSLIFDYFDKTNKMPKWCTISYRNGNMVLKSRR